jgi:hypothetical protein
MNEINEVCLTNTNVKPKHGRSIVRGVLQLKVNQIKSENIGEGTFFTGFFLEGTTDPNLTLGCEVLIDKSIAKTLGEFKYDKIDNPRDLHIIKELIDSLPGRQSNDMIVSGIKVEVWVYFMMWNNDIIGEINPDYIKPKPTFKLIPELEGVLTEGEEEESMLKLEKSLTNTKLSGNDVKRIITVDKPKIVLPN